MTAPVYWWPNARSSKGQASISAATSGTTITKTWRSVERMSAATSWGECAPSTVSGDAKFTATWSMVLEKRNEV
jgi:hypothetical protein